MGKQLIATGQATVIAQKDSYTINQSVGEYIFTAQSNGMVPAAVSFSSVLKVTLGDLNITDFTIGAITKPSGLITKDRSLELMEPSSFNFNNGFWIVPPIPPLLNHAP